MEGIPAGYGEGFPEAGSLVRHYKGGVYRVVCRALRESTGEEVVIYEKAGGPAWERTLADFRSEVSEAGVRRFEPLVAEKV